MKIISLLINEDVLRAESDLEQATSDTIVDACREYLAVLRRYRKHLLGLRDIPEINFADRSTLGRELTEQSRKAVRAAIAMTVSTNKLIEALLDSFTLINAWEAAETFNSLIYQGKTGWVMQGGEVFVPDSPETGRMKIAEAVENAARLRREAYVANRITFFEKDTAPVVAIGT